MIKGKAPEEIRRTFNIKNDFTPQEVRHFVFLKLQTKSFYFQEEQIKKENEWCEEK